MPALVLRTSVPQNINIRHTQRSASQARPGSPSDARADLRAAWLHRQSSRGWTGSPLATPTTTCRPGRASHVATHAMAPDVADALGRLCSIVSQPASAAFKGLGPDGVQAVNTLCQASAQGASGGNDLANTLANIGFPLLMVFGMYFLMRGRGGMPGGGPGGIMNFGQSRAKVSDGTESTVTFKDVAGIDYALEELREIVSFLKDPERYKVLGAKPPKGVLLAGNPGVGKTLLAQAIAGEAKVPFYSCNGSEFVEMFVGVGASRVRDLFNRAKVKTPCIIFIDELDAIGRARGSGPQVGGSGESENTLNQLLGEMDGFGPDAGIIVIAATNRADVLDPALVRPGRFDRQLTINPPDVKGRLHILKVHAEGRKWTKDVDWKRVARRTTGMTGADLNNLLNEAVMRACRLGKNEAGMEHIDWAYERIVGGAARPDMIVSPDKKRLVAYHEAGHALVGMLLGQEVASVSILPRDRAAGLTWFTPTERNAEGLDTLEDLETRLAVALGGRVAELFKYGEKGVTTGAASDLKKVSETAYAMVDSCAFGKGMAPRATLLGSGGGMLNGPQVSQELLAQRDRAANLLATEAAARATKLINQNKDALHAIANALLVAETISGDQLKAIVEGRKWDEVVVSEDGDELDELDELEAAEEAAARAEVLIAPEKAAA